MHEPVLVEEVFKVLHVPNGKYIDATEGAGGHSTLLVESGEVLGLDQDPHMLEVARNRIANPHLKLVNTNFINIKSVALENEFDQVDGILFDLGISSLHYEDNDRGFSFQYPDSKLDMRLDPETSAVSAADLLNILPQTSLEELFKVSLNPRDASRLSRDVVRYREKKKFETVGDFLEVTQFLHSKSGKHPATRAFMALRMAVNSELPNIEVALPDALELLRSGGKLAVITFHSMEDGLVKRIFLDFEQKNLGEVITKKPITPSFVEMNNNPKARSAKLRVFLKS